jgi:hypothetical protein
MTTSIQDKTTEYQQLVAGIQKNAPNLILTIGSQSYTSPQIVTVLQSLVSSSTTVATAKSAWHDAVLANQKVEKQCAPLVSELRQMIELMFSNSESTLAEFGLTPRRARKPMTTEQRAARAAKAKATREARGTTGKAQKAKLTGNVTGVTITPVVTTSSAPAAYSASTTPGPSTASATGTATTASTGSTPVVTVPAAPSASNGAAPAAAATAHA